MLRRSLILFLFLGSIVLRVQSQQIYIWDDYFGFGIADLSNCQIIIKYTTAPSFPGGTINVFQVPDGRLFRSNEIGCGFLSSTEPITLTKFKQIYNNPPRNITDRAIAVTCNAESKMIIGMYDGILNKTYLMYFDYTNGIFNIIGNLGNIENLRSLVAVGNKLLAFEEKLTPFRYYNLLEINFNDLSNNKVLFSIDTSYWAKDYTPNYISPSFRLFKSFDSCDSSGVYLSSTTNNDSTSKFYRIDFKNKAIRYICSYSSLQVLRGVDGINGFGFLKNCSLDFDLDINNSTDSLNNYSAVYRCPQSEQKIHDIDWLYYSDGPLDSLRVELTSNLPDLGNEYLLAKYQPSGLTIIGNGSSSLLFIPNKKIYSLEIEKILDGIVYYNDKLVPNIGIREIRSCIYVPWFQDTVITKIAVPVSQCW